MASQFYYNFSHNKDDKRRPPTERQRAKVQQALNPKLQMWGHEHAISSSGHVQFSPVSPVALWASALGECSDWRCGCSRMTRPEIRRSFRDLVADKVAERWHDEEGAAWVGGGGRMQH